MSIAFEKIAVFDKDGHFYLSAINTSNSRKLHLEYGDRVCSKCSWLDEIEYLIYNDCGIVRTKRPSFVPDLTIEWLKQELDWSDHPLS